MSFLSHPVATWLIEFQIAAFVVLLVTAIFLCKLKPGVGRVFVSWCAAISIVLLGCWLAIPERPVVQHIVMSSRAAAEQGHELIPERQPVADIDATVSPQTSEPQEPEFSPSLSEGAEPANAQSIAPESQSRFVDRVPLLAVPAIAMLIGFFVVITRNIAGRIALLRLMRTVQPPDDTLSQQFQSLRNRRGARLLLSPQLQHAVAVGVIRPVVLAPCSLGQASKQERDAVLKHELAHIENRDLWLLAILRWLGPLVAIQPLFWFLKRRLRESQELLADQRAAVENPVEYAELLVQWARETRATRRERLLPAAGILPFSQTGRRVMALLDSKLRPALSYPKRWLTTFALLLIAVTASTAAFTIRPAPQEDPSKPLDSSGLDEEFASLAASDEEIVGRVIDEDGNPLANVDVLLREKAMGSGGPKPSKRSDIARTRTNAKGEFRFKNLSALEMLFVYKSVAPLGQRSFGPFDVVAFSKNHASAHTEVRSRDVVTLRLTEPRFLSGRLETQSGAPIAGAKVRVVQLSQPDKPIRGDVSRGVRLTIDKEFLDLRHAKHPLVATTDADGRYTGIAVPRNKCITLEADHPDYVRHEFFCATTDSSQKDVVVSRTNGQAKTDKVHLEPPTIALTRGAEVEVRVLFADTGQPAIGAMVDPHMPHEEERQTVDETGRFRMRRLSSGAHRFYVRAPRGQAYLGSLDSVSGLEPGTTTQKTVKLERAAIVRGKIVAADTQKPIAKALAFLILNDNKGTYPVYSNERGEFIVRTKPGKGFVFVGRPVAGFVTGQFRSAGDFDSDDHQVNVTASLDQTVDIVLELERSPHVSGVCVDQDGKTLSGVEVLTAKAQDRGYISPNQTPPRGTTGKDGLFKLTDLYTQPVRPQDDYVGIAIQPAKKLAAQFRITRENTGKPLRVVLKPMESVEGQVLSGDGEPVSGATVELTGDWFNNRSIHRGRNAVKTSDSEGRFSFDRLIPGVRHHIQVHKDGYVRDRRMALVRRVGDKLTVKPERLRIEPVKPVIPSTRGMILNDALAVYAGGMPGEYDHDYPGGREQYLLDAATWGRGLREFAKRHPGKEVAFKACTKVLDTPYPDDSTNDGHAVRAIQRQVGQILLKDFAHREELSKYVNRLLGDDWKKGRQTAERLIDKNSDPNVASIALWYLSRAENHTDIKRLETIRDKYGKLPWGRGTMADEAARLIQIQTRYSTGKVPPDIVGKTLDGKEMKLSNHKGKVIVLYFWSSRFGRPLREMNRLNPMSRSLRDRPFQVLGVCMQDEEAAKEIVAKAKTKWPSWNDGPRGPISTNWGITYSRLMMIDHTGKIANDDLSPSDLVRAVRVALEKAEGKDGANDSMFFPENYDSRIK